MPDDFLLHQPRDYGDEINADEGLAKLAQAQTDEEALAIEANLLVETDEIIDPADQIEEVEESSS